MNKTYHSFLNHIGWIQQRFQAFKSLKKTIKTDIAIVGGGITGITAAYLLSQQGIQVTLIEAGHILTGTTGHTTAKITAQHGLIYDQLIQQHGENAAKLYYEANREAIELIKELINTAFNRMRF